MMQEPRPATQGSPGNLQGKLLLSKVTADQGQNAEANNTKVSDKEKIGITSKSSASSSKEICGKCIIFSCSSCSRKFPSQQALAGHRNIHKHEWEAELLKDTPDPTIAVKQPSVGNPHSILSNTSCTVCTPSHRTHPHPLAIPVNNHKGPSVSTHGHPLANPTNTLKGPSVCSPPHPLAIPVNNLKGPSVSTNGLPLAHPTIAVKWPSFGNPHSTLCNTSCTVCTPSHRTHPDPLAIPVKNYKGPSVLAHGHPLANPTNTLKGPSVYSPPHPLATPVNKLNGLSVLANGHPMANPTSTLKGPSVYSPPHPLAIPVNNLNGLSISAYGHPLANPTNTLKGPSVSAPSYPLANPTNALIWSSLGAPHDSFFAPETNHPVNTCTKPPYRLALGVNKPMIHKAYRSRQLGENDIWLKGRSITSHRQQMMEGNIGRLGANNNNFELGSLLMAAGAASSSRSEGGDHSEAANTFASSLKWGRGKGIEPQDIFALTPQGNNNGEINHFSQGVATQSNSNGGNDCSSDIDLELKL